MQKNWKKITPIFSLLNPLLTSILSKLEIVIYFPTNTFSLLDCLLLRHFSSRWVHIYGGYIAILWQHVNKMYSIRVLFVPPILHMRTQHCRRNHFVYTLQWWLLVNRMIYCYGVSYLCVRLAVNPSLWLGAHMWDWHGQISIWYYPKMRARRRRGTQNVHWNATMSLLL